MDACVNGVATQAVELILVVGAAVKLKEEIKEVRPVCFWFKKLRHPMVPC